MGIACDIPIPGKIKLAVKNDDIQKTIIDLNGLKIGGDQVIIMAGPCSVETREQVLEAARSARDS